MTSKSQTSLGKPDRGGMPRFGSCPRDRQAGPAPGDDRSARPAKAATRPCRETGREKVRPRSIKHSARRRGRLSCRK